MTSYNRTINWLLAMVICMLMGSTYLLDGPTDLEAAADTAASVLDAQAAAKDAAKATAKHAASAATHQRTTTVASLERGAQPAGALTRPSSTIFKKKRFIQMAQQLYRVRLHRRGGKTSGHIDVLATCPKHAQRVAVAQTIEVSYPKSKPAQWVVDSVEERV